MYLYSITINIEDDVKATWLKWMKDEYIPLLQATGLFHSTTFLELLTGEVSSGSTYALQLFFHQENDFLKYEEKHLEEHQHIHQQKFNGKFVEFRSLLKSVE